MKTDKIVSTLSVAKKAPKFASRLFLPAQIRPTRKTVILIRDEVKLEEKEASG